MIDNIDDFSKRQVRRLFHESFGEGLDGSRHPFINCDFADKYLFASVFSRQAVRHPVRTVARRRTGVLPFHR